MSFSYLLFSLLGGILPPLFWLWFWLKEDRLHPEPRRLLMLTFLGGMLMVALALLLEQFTVFVFRTSGIINALDGFLILFFWAGAEEISKYLAASKIALNKKEYDEPVDALIYMITAALGFAAIENILVLFQAIPNGANAAVQIWLLRFVGATLLHGSFNYLILKVASTVLYPSVLLFLAAIFVFQDFEILKDEDYLASRRILPKSKAAPTTK